MSTGVIIALVVQLVFAFYYYFFAEEYSKATFWVAVHVANFLWINMYLN